MAKEFAENARKLREQAEIDALGAEADVEPVERETKAGLASEFADLSGNLNATMHSKDRIKPVIDNLISDRMTAH